MPPHSLAHDVCRQHDAQQFSLDYRRTAEMEVGK